VRAARGDLHKLPVSIVICGDDRRRRNPEPRQTDISSPGSRSIMAVIPRLQAQPSPV